jgi:hypothetical protein
VYASFHKCLPTVNQKRYDRHNVRNKPLPASPVRRLVRLIVYVMLLVSFGTLFFLGDKLWAAARTGQVPIWAALMPILAFTAFVLVYSIDRWLLIKKRGYPLLRAILQVSLAIGFSALLWPHQAANFRETREAVANFSVINLLEHRDARVRALACEVLGFRHDNTAYERMQRMVNADKSAATRLVCSEALRKIQP